MANGKLLRQLIKSGVQGNVVAFRAAAEAAIAEEREKQHHMLANDLEHLLYATETSGGKLHRLAPAPPETKDGGLPLAEVRPATREERDLILAAKPQQAIDNILREHHRGDVLRSYGLQPARKLLFCGPPGCGKTLAAEVIANALTLPLVVVRLDSVISSFLGETATNLRRVFDYAARAPAVVLFDEFDALSKDRGDAADHGELKRAVNAVLQMMDAYRGESILIATTNYPRLLDHAVWRRFDEVVTFELPDAADLQRLLALKLSGVRRNFDVAEPAVVARFAGKSHADVERVIRRAVKAMVLDGREFVELTHLDAALERETR